MSGKKFSAPLREIAKHTSNNDLTELIADKLQIPLDKAEALSNRLRNTPHLTTEKSQVRPVVEKLSKPEQKAVAYLIETLSDKEFALFIQWLFESLGYAVLSKCLTNSGVDLTVIQNNEKVTVLARKYPPNYALTDVTVLAAQQTQNTPNCSRTIIITTSCFTEQATLAAQKCNVELWDHTVLDTKIEEEKKKATQDNQQTRFPPYQGSLLLSLLMLAETKTFHIEPKTERKYDLFLPGIKYPLLTFEAPNSIVMRCIFRIEYNEPVSESDGKQLITTDENGNKKGPDDLEAYELITQYLTQFLE